MHRSLRTISVIHQTLRIMQRNGMPKQNQLMYHASSFPHCSGNGHVGALSQKLGYYAPRSLTCLKPSLSSVHMEQRKSMSTDTARPGNLMDFPHILFPSFIKMAKNVFFTWFIIRPYLDPNFSFKTFMDGAKQVSFSLGTTNFQPNTNIDAYY